MSDCVKGDAGGGEVDEFSDTLRTDTAELHDTDGQLESDVCDDMDRPVWIYGSRMVDNLSQASQALSSNRDVACMGDFVDEDFNDTGFDSGADSRMAFEWNGWDDACTGESEISPPDSVTVFPASSAKEVLCYRDDKKSPEEGACCAGILSDNCATRYIYIVPDVLSNCVCWNSRANETGMSGV